MEIWKYRNAIQAQSFLPVTSVCEVNVPFAKPGADEWEIRRDERGRQRCQGVLFTGSFGAEGICFGKGQ